ncbi:hypothetical protein [Xylella fastidiosa]|uniref:hypothetical protein n=1 Tax=Xylella fastidiosa TaxID=2371 RepID=UPI000A416172|nr:hypothetical protein [Xylella fastidiosa]
MGLLFHHCCEVGLLFDFIGIIFFCNGMGESHVIVSITQCELLIVLAAFIRCGSVLRSTLVMRDFYVILVVVRSGKYLNWFGVKDGWWLDCVAVADPLFASGLR